MDWFRWHHGSVNDPKFQLVAKRARASVAEVIAVWATVLEAASAYEERGVTGDIDCEAVDCALGMDDGKTAAILSAMGDRGLIGDGGEVKSWEKRQPRREREDDTAADRKRRQRERQAQEKQELANAGGHVTPCHAASHQKPPRGEEIREEEIRAKSNSKELVSPNGDPPSRFDDFWREYPRDEGKKKAREAWGRKKLDAIADRIIADVVARKAGHGQWLDGYVPHATTYLNGERWNDAIKPRDGPKLAQQAPTSKTAQALMALEAMKSGNGMATGSGFGGAATSRLLGFGSDPGGGGVAADGRGVGRVFDA